MGGTEVEQIQNQQNYDKLIKFSSKLIIYSL